MNIDQNTHEQLERSLQEIDWTAYTQRTYILPAAWEDQVLYFLMLDRFPTEGERVSGQCRQPRSLRHYAAIPLHRGRLQRRPGKTGPMPAMGGLAAI